MDQDRTARRTGLREYHSPAIVHVCSFHSVIHKWDFPRFKGAWKGAKADSGRMDQDPIYCSNRTDLRTFGRTARTDKPGIELRSERGGEGRDGRPAVPS